jgi:hypothetical protein
MKAKHAFVAFAAIIAAAAFRGDLVGQSVRIQGRLLGTSVQGLTSFRAAPVIETKKEFSEHEHETITA